MLQKFKTTSIVFILFLFGFTLITVSPVFAGTSRSFKECDSMRKKRSKVSLQNKNELFYGPRYSTAGHGQRS